MKNSQFVISFQRTNESFQRYLMDRSGNFSNENTPLEEVLMFDSKEEAEQFAIDNEYFNVDIFDISDILQEVEN